MTTSLCHNVSYRALNAVTKTFSFPILCCYENVENIENVGDSNGLMFYIKLERACLSD